jgi:hypothetical protein
MKMKFLLILAIYILSSTQMISQWSIMRSDADSLVRLGTGYIYNVEFSKAEECFRQVKDIYPEHPAGYFLDAMVEWWRITLDRSTNRHDANFLDKISKVISLCDNLLKDNPSNLNGLFFKAGAIGFRGRFYAQKEEWIKAASDGSSAYKLLIECYKIAPQNHDIMLGTGIYNYFAVAVTNK